ncbi:7095_t:CDS:2 [Ambispora leptoticha]|uniref:7095_t:CDS:1 n=1 Tax=Ambispora leptoticha TaxID=144679 RepID=A0A9N9ATA8_9GLOM|nr:7095_t:CDS:2 [Ambispora leptoticha]
MSRLPKLPVPSSLPTSGLTPPKKRTTSNASPLSTVDTTANTTTTKIAGLKDLTPEQEALLQEAMEKFNPEANTNTSTSSPSTTISSLPTIPTPTTATSNGINGSPNSNQLRKPGSRKQSVSRVTRPVLPSVSDMPPLPTIPQAVNKSNTNQGTRKLSFGQHSSSTGLAPPGSSLQMRPPTTTQTSLAQPSLTQSSLTPPSALTQPASLLKNNRIQALAAASQRPASPSLGLYSVGERVSVESMNITGTLKFLGSIGGKSGTWAGIELDVPGTGKNDGSANGVSYFTCPPKTGIFVLATKLSKEKEDSETPTTTSSTTTLTPLSSSSPLNKNTLSIPSIPQPSQSNTNVTPNESRIASKNAQHAAVAASRISAGSRASKYIGVTASQLKQKSLIKPASFTQAIPNPSPDPSNRGPSPPSKLKFGLPRPNASNLKSPLTSPVNVRRTRRRDSNSSNGSVASVVSQPTLQVSSFGFQRSSRATTPNEQQELQTPSSDSETTLTNIELTNKSLQEKIEKLLNGSDASDAPPLNVFDQQMLRIQQLQMKIDVLESENSALKLNNKNLTSSTPSSDESNAVWIAEKNALNDKINQLTKQLEESSKGHHHRPSTSLSMLADEDLMNDKILQLTELIETKEAAVKSLEQSLNTYQSRITELELANKEQEAKIQELNNSNNKDRDKDENTALEDSSKRIAELEKGIDAKALEISQLVMKLDQTQLDSESKIRSLQTTVDQFKAAGQETINIYEDKVSTLSQQIEELKRTSSETRALYSETKALYEEATAKLGERENKITTLEKETEELRSAGVEAIDVYEKTMEDLKKEMEEVKQQLSRKDEALTASRKELESLRSAQKELNEAKTKLEQKDKREEGLRNELADLQTGLEHMMRADAKSRERIYQLEDEMRESQATVNRQLEEISALKLNIQELMNTNSTDEIEKVKTMYEMEIKRMGEELESSRKSLSDVQTEKRVAMKEFNNLQNRLKDKEDENDKLLKELEESKLNTKELEETNKNVIHRTEDEKEKLKKEVNDLRANIREREEANKVAMRQADQEKEELAKELRTIKFQLNELEASNKDATQQFDIEKAALIEARNVALKDLEEIKEKLHELSVKASQSEELKASLASKSEELKKLTELKMIAEIENKNFENENEQLKQKIKELAINSKSSDSTPPAKSQEVIDKITAYEEQITGLKQIVHELTRENIEIDRENKKMLAEHEKLAEAHKQVENECFKLMDELERLHSESLSGQGILAVPAVVSAEFPSSPETPRDDPSEENSVEEDGTDTTPTSPQTATNTNTPTGTTNVTRLESLLAEKQTQLDRLTSLHNSEIRELRQKIAELEKSKQRELTTLTKDVAELESLVESKIFREADLEEEIQRERLVSKRLRDEIEDLKEQIKEIRAMGGDELSLNLGISISSNDNSPKRTVNEDISEKGSSRLYCEICEEEGHDIISCKAVFGMEASTLGNGATPLPIVASNGNIEEERPVS